MSNEQSSFHVIDFKLDIEPSLTPQRPAAANEVAARCVTLHPIGATYSDEYLCTGGTYRNDIVQ